MDQLRTADSPSIQLLSSIKKRCHRIAASLQSPVALQIDRLTLTGAWTEAALALLEAELPFWKLRGLAYDDGRWFCAISRQRELPEWLDQAVEADHENLSLAILSAFVAALLESSASKQVSVPAARLRDEQYVTLDCGNFA